MNELDNLKRLCEQYVIPGVIASMRSVIRKDIKDEMTHVWERLSDLAVSIQDVKIGIGKVLIESIMEARDGKEEIKS